MSKKKNKSFVSPGGSIDRARRMTELRRSNAAGIHDGRPKRSADKRHAIRFSVDNY